MSKLSKNVETKLIQQFFSGMLNFSLQEDEVKKFTWEKQQSFLSATVNNETVKKYPVSSEFCRIFMKKVINCLESYQEVHDEFYTTLCSILENHTKEEFCYRHYILGDDFENKITIKETKNIVVNGTTGMRTWQAALMLADFAICNKCIFESKKVLELGSGVGFTGIAIAKQCNVDSILLTDCHDDVLQTISENVRINFPQVVQEENGLQTNFKDAYRNIGVMMLDWNYIENIQTNIVPDVLIGADIIYDPTILKPLCNVIKTFFERNKYLEVYIANIIRNEETYKQFLENLDDYNFAWSIVSQPNSIFIKWDQNIQRSLLKIQLK